MLLYKPPCHAEVYNDLDGEIVNLFRVARDRGDELVRVCELTPYSREEFNESFVASDDPLEQARRTVFRSFAGFGGNLTRQNRDLTPQRTGFRNYSLGNRRVTRAAPANEWRKWPDGLVQIIDRLRGVIIEQRDASVILREHDGPETLHYVDPPYVHSTRGYDAGGSHRGYRFEMSDAQHRLLAIDLRSLRGLVVLSGYPCDLYDIELYSKWERCERESLADGGRPRVEVLWLNPAASAALRSSRDQGCLGVDA